MPDGKLERTNVLLQPVFARRRANVTPDEYLRTVLDHYNLPVVPHSPVPDARAVIEPVLRAWAGRFLLDISFTGSYCKGTRIRGVTDADLLVSLGPKTPCTMKDLYGRLFAALKKANLSPVEGGVSVDVTVHGVKFDIIPGRRQWGAAANHEIFRTEREKPIITDLEIHVDRVRHSHRLDEIRATKIWAQNHKLRFPSFYLELTVMAALADRPAGATAENFLSVLEYLRDRFANTRVVDPANHRNAISDDLLLHERLAVADAAGVTLKQSAWDRIVWVTA